MNSFVDLFFYKMLLINSKFEFYYEELYWFFFYLGVDFLFFLDGWYLYLILLMHLLLISQGSGFLIRSSIFIYFFTFLFIFISFITLKLEKTGTSGVWNRNLNILLYSLILSIILGFNLSIISSRTTNLTYSFFS